MSVIFPNLFRSKAAEPPSEPKQKTFIDQASAALIAKMAVEDFEESQNRGNPFSERAPHREEHQALTRFARMIQSIKDASPTDLLYLKAFMASESVSASQDECAMTATPAPQTNSNDHYLSPVSQPLHNPANPCYQLHPNDKVYVYSMLIFFCL